MKIIKTKKGQEIMVDDALFEYLDQFWWTTSGGKYAYRQKITKDGKTRKKCYMHHEVLGRPTKRYPHTDHIDRNPLNNQRANLRHVSVAVNHHNTPVRKHSVVGLKGVGKLNGSKKFSARISHKHKTYHLGSFKTPQQAHEAYLKAEKKLYANE